MLKRTILLTAVLGLTAGAAQAQAASVTITGPATAQAEQKYTADVAVDPANDAGNANPVLTVEVAAAGSCPAGPGLNEGLELFSTPLDAAGGPKAGTAFYNPTAAGSFTLCAWLAENSVAQTAYAAGALTVAVTKAVPVKQPPSVTAAWGQTAKRTCRVEGDVTPRGAGKVSLQRRSGSKWVTVKAVRINDTKYVTTFSPKNGQTFRVFFPGSDTLEAKSSLSHKVKKRGKYEC